MKDVNYPLRVALITALKLTGEAAYYMQAPDNLKGNYIVLNSIGSTPVDVKTGSIITATSQITIYTEGQQYNSGDAADTIAGKIFEYIYPTPHHVLDLGEGLQMVSTDLVSDNTNTFTLKNQVIAVDRVITFRHNISIR